VLISEIRGEKTKPRFQYKRGFFMQFHDQLLKLHLNFTVLCIPKNIKMKALTFSSFGESDVLEYIEIPNPQLQNDEILVEMKAIGLNFADVYRRKGNYHLKGNPPFIAGYEGAGIVADNNNHPE
jgi:hypothetical protein